MQEQNQTLVPYQGDEQVAYSYPVYTDEYRRRPGSGFGGFGRPGFGYGRPGFGYGYGAPFLGGVVGGLIGSSFLYPPYYNRPRPYPYYPYPYYPYPYPYYNYGYGY